MVHSVMALQVFRLVALAWALQVTAAKLANYISACSVKDPELNECILKQAIIFQPIVAKGIKEFGLPSLDPLELPVMSVDRGTGGAVGIAINITDSKHYGWTENVPQKITADLKNHHFEIYLSVPRYMILGDYAVKGQILVLPITGTGAANFTLENVNTTVTLDGKREQRRGEEYLKITTVKVFITYGKIHVNLDNLFGNKQLSDSTNVILNQNGREAFNELKPAIEEVFSEIYMSILGRLFSRVPYNQLFTLD